MRTIFFIAQRLLGDKDNKNKISSPIIKISFVSIAIGMIIILISLATGKGLQHKIREKISAFSGHILIINFDTNQSGLTLEPISIRQNFYPKFENIKGIKNVQAFATIGGIIRTEKDFEGIVFKGVDSLYDWEIFKPYLIQGKIPHFNLKKTNDSVLISQTIANRLHLKLHDKFNAYFMRKGSQKPQLRILKISGIYDSGFDDFDKTFLLGDLRIVQKLYKWPDTLTGGFEIILNDFNQIDKKTNEIYEQIGSTLNTISIKEKYPMIFNWVQMFDFNILMILVIIIFIAGLNMITTLLVMILEKRQFIAVMKVLGMTNWQLQKIFLIQSAYIISIGLFFGNLIGLGLIFIQKYFGIIRLDPETYYVRVAPVFINLKYIIMLNIGIMSAILLMLLLPVLVISQISPVKVLKYD